MSDPPIQTDVDGVHAHPRHVGHRPTDLILALSAIFISTISLYVAIEHGQTERQLVQANSWPFLQIESAFSEIGPSRIVLTGAGVGPAKLRTLQVFYQGQPVDDFRALMRRCCDLADTEEGRRRQFPEGLVSSDLTGSVIRPGETKLLMQIPASPDLHQVSDRFRAASAVIGYRACYCSVFDQCWISGLTGLDATPVRACPTGIRSFNEGAR